LEQAAATLEAERALARRAGLLLTPAEMRARLAVPPDEDADPFYRAFGRLWEAAPSVDKTRRGETLNRILGGQFAPPAGPPFTNGIGKPERVTSPDRADLARALIVECADLLAVARQAAARPRSRVRVRWGAPTDVALADITRHTFKRNAARLLAADAVASGYDDRLDRAVDALRACVQIERHVGQEPILLGELVRSAIGEYAHKAFEQVIKSRAGQPDALETLGRLNSSLAYQPDPRELLPGELFFALGAVQSEATLRKALVETYEFETREPDEQKFDRRLAREPLALVRAALEARVLAYFRTVQDALGRAGSDLLAQRRAVEAVAERETAYPLAKAPSRRYSRDVAWWSDILVLGLARTVTRTRLRGALVAVLLDHARTGDWPNALPGAAATLVDPFDNRPLRYRRTPNGFRVWSVGVNDKDDGGVTTRDANGAPRDLAVTYP